jgi:hypothetical protein
MVVGPWPSIAVDASITVKPTLVGFTMSTIAEAVPEGSTREATWCTLDLTVP